MSHVRSIKPERRHTHLVPTSSRCSIRALPCSLDPLLHLMMLISLTQLVQQLEERLPLLALAISAHTLPKHSVDCRSRHERTVRSRKRAAYVPLLGCASVV